MQYQLINWQQNGSVRDNGDGTSSMPIMVTTGVVGDTYGFIKNDPTTSLFLNTKTADEIKAIVTQTASDFVKTKYPNT